MHHLALTRSRSSSTVRVIRHGVVRLAMVPLRRRWAEFASYAGGIGLLIGGIHALPALGLGPAGIVLVLLLVVALSIAVLVLGMMSSLCQSPKESA